jgi:hypothetical protein
MRALVRRWKASPNTVSSGNIPHQDVDVQPDQLPQALQEICRTCYLQTSMANTCCPRRRNSVCWPHWTIRWATRTSRSGRR